MPYVTVEITQSAINRGIEGNCNECPIQLALRAHVDFFTAIQVYEGSVMFRPMWVGPVYPEVYPDSPAYAEHELYASTITYPLRYTAMSVNTPPEVRRFVRRFDKGLPVQPFSIEMYIPEWCYIGAGY